ncbi:conserved hypothetical protein [Frankia canadensis]|uniref:OmpR/PhoB-type domain-containing protein n=2 Tax=Frankia canadensis TaxID=1836972 RepID=A0A2I2L265_9ACTN|nr:conserved hypothetical protein [Frankia canadensis]SOU59316.1 conserved hypothetical protein [Frankia canadensis]
MDGVLMEFRVLGPVEACRSGRRIDLAGAKLRTVLAALLLARGHVVSDQRLTSLLWGWGPPVTMYAQLYTYISRLRKLLGKDVSIDRRFPGYVLDIGESRLDLIEFERLERSGREALLRGDSEKASTLLGGALAEWSGPAFSNVTEFLAEIEGPPLAESRAVALENRITADLELGRHHQLTPELAGLLTEFPLRERLRAQAMTALYRSGRQADALGLFHEGRRTLAEELGVEPGEELMAAYQAVLHGSRASRTNSWSVDSPVAPGDAVPAMLPPDSIDFAGRQSELTSLCRLLEPRRDAGAPSSRRVLVTGMAGMGKTALAVRAAHSSLQHFPDGQLHADLRHPDGTPKDPREILVRLLRALGAPVSGYAADDLDALVHLYRARISNKQLLILLDDAASDTQLVPLLPNTPEPAVLITSRTVLPTVTGSRTIALRPLDGVASLQLLAAAAGPERIAAVPEAAAALVSYCAGLPLALRIAGARTAARPHSDPAVLAGRLADPATRLRELRFGELDVSKALMPSWHGLDGPARAAFPRLAPLGQSPFPAARAAAQLAEPETYAELLLEALVDAALLEVSEADEQGRPHYVFHPLTLLFARSLCGRGEQPGPGHNWWLTPDHQALPVVAVGLGVPCPPGVPSRHSERSSA